MIHQIIRNVPWNHRQAAESDGWRNVTATRWIQKDPLLISIAQRARDCALRIQIYLHQPWNACWVALISDNSAVHKMIHYLQLVEHSLYESEKQKQFCIVRSEIGCSGLEHLLTGKTRLRLKNLATQHIFITHHHKLEVTASLSRLVSLTSSPQVSRWFPRLSVVGHLSHFFKELDPRYPITLHRSRLRSVSALLLWEGLQILFPNMPSAWEPIFKRFPCSVVKYNNIHLII